MKLQMRWMAMIAAAALCSGVAAAQTDDVETRAMRDEMQRSLKELHLDANQRPYFVSYKITDVDQMDARASFGALTGSQTGKTRMLSVDVRVGDYNLDSSNYVNRNSALSELMGLVSGITNLVLPVEDNYDELRRKIWLATDGAYKKAIEDYSGKKAALAARGRDEESVPDFSKGEARQESEMPAAVPMDMAHAEQLVKTASAVFRSLPGAETSSAQFEVSNFTEHFLDSEGTSYVRRDPEVFFHAAASLQNATGETFSDSVSEYGHSLSELPDDAKLTSESKEVVDHLTQRLKGKVAKRYNGPVLVEGEAAGELFARNFGNQLSARGAGGASNSLLGALMGTSTTTTGMINKVGTRVLPDFLTVVNNPLQTEAEDHKLLGTYKFDEEGIPAQETVLVKDGMLKTLLNSRRPARGMPTSTGSMRATGVMPGNLFVETSKSATREELKKQLIALIAQRGLEYGYIVQRLANNTAVEATRVFPDGREELVRDARVAQVNTASFKDVLAVSKDRTVFTDRASGGSFALGATPSLVTYVVPDMLFEDMSIEHVNNTTPKLPVVPSPMAEQ